MTNFFFVTLSFFSSLASAAIISSTVPAQEGRSCQAHLRLPAVKKKLPLVVSLGGTGIYSTANDEELSPAMSYLYDNEKSILLTLDKPGISWQNKSLKVDSQVYNQYLLTDLVHCLKNALQRLKSMKSLPFNHHIILIGHSEGAMVLARLILNYEKSKDPILDKIKLVIFSATPVEKFKTIVKKQLDPGEHKKFWQAYKNKDNKYLRKWGEVSFAYLENNFKLKSFKKIMKELVALNSRENFQFFHGLNDQLTSVKAVRELETWNESLKKSQKNSLQMNARYYQSDHFLNLSAINDMIAITVGYLN